MHHTIRISQISSGKYAVTGSANITSTSSPVPDAARELLARGASLSDELRVNCGVVSILPQTLARLTAPRRKVLRSEIEHQQRY
jgi:hypothetical protein